MTLPSEAPAHISPPPPINNVPSLIWVDLNLQFSHVSFEVRRFTRFTRSLETHNLHSSTLKHFKKRTLAKRPGKRKHFLSRPTPAKSNYIGMMLPYFGSVFFAFIATRIFEIVGNILSARRARGPENDFAHALPVLCFRRFRTK